MKRSGTFAAVALATVSGPASQVKADALINLQVLGSADNQHFSNTVPVTPGVTVYYELVGRITPATTPNSQSSFTGAPTLNATDGIGGINGVASLATRPPTYQGRYKLG